MRRALAVLGALAMIAAAVLIRHQIDDDGANRPNADDKIVIVCAADLETYCDAFGDEVEVRLASANDTAEEIRDDALAGDVDGWVTSSAWLELLGEEGAGLGPPERLATSPTTVAALADRADAIAALCGSEPLWGCLAESAGASWSELDIDLPGRLEVGVPSANTATGLPVLASVAAGSLGSTTFASNDFDAEFRAQLAALLGASDGQDQDPVRTMVTQRGRYSAAGSPLARVDELRNDAVESLDTAPVVDATVVMVPVSGGDALPDPDPVRKALVAESWRAASGSDVTPTLKDGVMSALHQVWLESTP